MSEKSTITYNPDLPRTDRTQHRLDLIQGEREGRVTGVLRDGVAPTPVMVKSCHICKKPCPITNKGFVCVKCVVLFR